MDFPTVVIWLKISFVFYILTMIAIVDIALKDFSTMGKKVLWGIIALIPFVGWLIYLVLGFRKYRKPEKNSKSPSNNV